MHGSWCVCDWMLGVSNAVLLPLCAVVGLGTPPVHDRSLVILARKFLVVIIGALVSGQPRFAAVITTVSLFVSFVLQKAYTPYRVSSGADSILGAPPGSGKLRLRCVCECD